MHADLPPRFHRDMACTEAEWLGWLPGAVRGHALEVGAGTARVQVGGGMLTLRWQRAEPRVIALIKLPRLAVDFEFDGVDEAPRRDFMRYFDLYMQRGGG